MRVSATYARQNFAALLEQVLKGEEVSIERHGRTLAKLVPAGASVSAEVLDEIELLPEPRPPKGNSRLERLFHQRALDRFREAAPAARKALAKLRSLGVRARVIGSLARGTFKDSSDVDFLIEDARSIPDLRIERLIKEQLRDVPFDVVHLDRLSPAMRETILQETRAWPSPSSRG